MSPQAPVTHHVRNAGPWTKLASELLSVAALHRGVAGAFAPTTIVKIFPLCTV